MVTDSGSSLLDCASTANEKKGQGCRMSITSPVELRLTVQRQPLFYTSVVVY